MGGGADYGLRAVRRVPVAAAALLLLAGATCIRNGRNEGQATTRPASSRPRRKWPGKTGEVNRLVVWLRGTGRAGFALVVNTMQVGARSGVRFAVEEGSFTFRLYQADAMGRPVPEKRLGAWRFDESAVRDHWSPGGWGGNATFTFLLRWQGPPPPPTSNLVLVTEFRPRGRNVVIPHRLAFTIQPSLRPPA